ncbi:F-box/LRR-repeat protein 8-like isoform X3 [Erythrolamprus reginae]|uniref:F-box/LRR-repeat protein 8-like isoform X3 n=1 Tax=Erythrolamprus reginae TaxID=121349 RepID=UPI00396CDFD7
MSDVIDSLWNYMPEEIIACIFSFLSVTDRHTVSHVCRKWAEAVASPAVWRFTDLSFDFKEEEEVCILSPLEPYLVYIRHLRIELNHMLDINRNLVTELLEMLSDKKAKLQVLCIIGQGWCPYFDTGQEILESVGSYCQSDNKTHLQHVNFQHMPFVLDNFTVLLLAYRSPHLHTLMLNNQSPAPIILKPETIVEIVQACPKLTVLGIYYAVLSKDLLQELVKPNRGPFECLDIFYEYLDKQIPEECWATMSKRHPQFRVKLEIGAMVDPSKLTDLLKPQIPVKHLQFNYLHYLIRELGLITKFYSQTVETLSMYTAPSDDLNAALIELAKKCSRLKEVHCFCVVSRAVVVTFLSHCSGLQNYTLSTKLIPSMLPIVCP